MNSFDSAKRHAIADMHLNAAADTLTHPNVRKELGEYGERLLEILDWLYVPNMRNGVYEAPRRFRHSERIPLFISYPGEVTQYASDNIVTMHPDQIRALDKARVNFGDTKVLDADIDELVDEVEENAQYPLNGRAETIPFPDWYGYVHTLAGGIHLPVTDTNSQGTHWVQTRPFIVLNSLLRDRDAGTLVHEIVHADQHLSDESIDYETSEDSRTAAELPANYWEIKAIRAKHGGIVPREYEFTERRERLRLYANGNGEDMFKVTPKLKRLMARHGYSSTFGVRTVPIKVNNKNKNKHGRVGVKVTRR